MSDPELLLVAQSDELAEGEIRRVSLPLYEPLALCRSGGKLHLLADTCSHGMASLSEGEVEGGQVFCPFHGGAFDVSTGKATVRPCVSPIRVYPLIERDGQAFVASK